MTLPLPRPGRPGEPLDQLAVDDHGLAGAGEHGDLAVHDGADMSHDLFALVEVHGQTGFGYRHRQLVDAGNGPCDGRRAQRGAREESAPRNVSQDWVLPLKLVRLLAIYTKAGRVRIMGLGSIA